MCFAEACMCVVVVQVLDRRLRRIADEIRLGVADEIDTIAAQGLSHLEETGWAQLTSAFPSADSMLDEIQVCDSVQRACTAACSPSWWLLSAAEELSISENAQQHFCVYSAHPWEEPHLILWPAKKVRAEAF